MKNVNLARRLLAVAKKIVEAEKRTAKPTNLKLNEATEDLAYWLAHDVHDLTYRTDLNPGVNPQVEDFIKKELAEAIEKIRSKAKKMVKK